MRYFVTSSFCFLLKLVAFELFTYHTSKKNQSLIDLKFLSPTERLDLPNRKENVKNQFSGAKTGGDEVA